MKKQRGELGALNKTGRFEVFLAGMETSPNGAKTVEHRQSSSMQEVAIRSTGHGLPIEGSHAEFEAADLELTEQRLRGHHGHRVGSRQGTV